MIRCSVFRGTRHRWGTRLRRGFLPFTLALALDAGEPAVVPLERDFIVRTSRPESGLPDTRVLSLFVDRTGFLWVGTRKGVSRFDGSRFVTWSRASHQAFVAEECRALAQDREGILWVGTANGVVRLADPPARFEPARIDHFKEGTAGPAENSIRALQATDAGELLVGTDFGFVVRSPDGTWDRPEAAEWSRMRITMGFAALPDGSILAGTSTQLLRREHPGGTWVPQFGQGESDATNFIHGVAVGTNGFGYALVGSWSNGSGRLYRREGTGWALLLDRDLHNFSHPLFLKADLTGGLWFPTTGPRIGCWREGGLTEYALPPELSGDVFRCLAQDAEGNIWAGTSRNGLLCLQPRHIQSLTVADGLPDPKTWALLETTDGTLWVGTDGGLVRLQGTERRVITTASGLPSDKIRALATDSSGRVWIGTGSGLCLWDGARIQTIEYPGERYRHKIRTLHTGRDGAVWVGTAQGLHRFRAGETNAWSVAGGLPHENVCAVLEDRQRQVWIGTDGGGLARLTDSGFERWTESHGLTSLRVFELFEDEAGAIWIGTDRGLNVLRNGRLASVTTAQGLPDNTVNSVVEDASGWLWIAHPHGIYRVQRQELLGAADGARARVRCIAYSEADGLLNPETNGQNSHPTALRRRDGRIAFATMGGVAIFDPTRLSDLTNGPPAHIEELRAGGRVHYSGRPGNEDAAGRARRTTGPLRIAPQNRGFVEVHFGAVAFRAPDHVRFRHRLLGLSADWVDAGTLRQASYANLRPADYTFEVSAVNAHGYSSPTPARIEFRIEPIWHERWTVRLTGLALLLTTTFALVRWRVGELRRISDLEQQAAVGRERARLAKDLHDGLGANLTEITLLSGLGDASALSSEVLAERFRRLTQSTQEALHSLRNLIWVTNPKADSLEMLVARICESAERTLDAAGIRCRVDFPPELPAVTVGPDPRRDLLFAVNEAVNNIVRHAQARQVQIAVTVAKGGFAVSIKDDGRGFDPAEAPRRTGSGDRGLGLASLRDRLSPHGGVCEIRSQPGQGTEVTLRMPLPK